MDNCFVFFSRLVLFQALLPFCAVHFCFVSSAYLLTTQENYRKTNQVVCQRDDDERGAHSQNNARYEVILL